MSKKLSLVVLLLAPALALAAEEAHTVGEEGIPRSVVYQAINFVIYVGILIYFLRHPVKKYFKDRAENFKSALIKAEHAKHDAEVKKREVMNRLSALESTTAESLAQAKKEAEALSAKIQADAKEMAEKLRSDARAMTAIEIERAKNELREELLAQSVTLAEKFLSEKIVDADQHRLQTEFVDKIQVVR